MLYVEIDESGSYNQGFDLEPTVDNLEQLMEQAFEDLVHNETIEIGETIGFKVTDEHEDIVISGSISFDKEVYVANIVGEGMDINIDFDIDI